MSPLSDKLGLARQHGILRPELESLVAEACGMNAPQQMVMLYIVPSGLEVVPKLAAATNYMVSVMNHQGICSLMNAPGRDGHVPSVVVDEHMRAGYQVKLSGEPWGLEISFSGKKFSFPWHINPHEPVDSSGVTNWELMYSALERLQAARSGLRAPERLLDRIFWGEGLSSLYLKGRLERTIEKRLVELGHKVYFPV
ncbi:hypothetical protein HYY72_05685 [Candidatus Woesearchaeota archaeon]|nr:hypothetical protein [Candidatus Woesearchaeota archaeon]